MRGDLLPGEASAEGARVCEAEDEVDGLPNHGLSPDSAKLRQRSDALSSAPAA
jgi:hypothetical protein